MNNLAINILAAQQVAEEGVEVVQPERVVRPKKFVLACEATTGRMYSLWVEKSDKGTCGYVKAEFLTHGRGEFRNLSFFRKLARSGQYFIFGVPNTLSVMEVGLVVITED